MEYKGTLSLHIYHIFTLYKIFQTKNLVIFLSYPFLCKTFCSLYQTIIYGLDIENNGKKLYNRECVMSLQHNARDGTLSMIYDRRG